MTMFTYLLVGAGAVLLGAAVWHQVRTWNKPGRHIRQDAPMDDPMNAQAKWQHDSTHNSPWNSGGVG
ncbi:MAG: hypothetical protein H6529_03200 [Nocardioides sp.]|nr:hypothetical protein [Nocardioidaceae bacterium]MCB8955467.1 hypothetical protein [Nocardioides sp.]